MYEYGHAGDEPTLSEILADPIIHRVMARDHVQAEEIRYLLRQMRMRLAYRGLRSRSDTRWLIEPAA